MFSFRTLSPNSARKLLEENRYVEQAAEVKPQRLPSPLSSTFLELHNYLGKEIQEASKRYVMNVAYIRPVKSDVPSKPKAIPPTPGGRAPDPPQKTQAKLENSNSMPNLEPTQVPPPPIPIQESVSHRNTCVFVPFITKQIPVPSTPAPAPPSTPTSAHTQMASDKSSQTASLNNIEDAFDRFISSRH